MRILHVIPSLSPAEGGPSHVLPLMAKGLEQLGHEVIIATTHEKGDASPPTAMAHHSFPRQSEFYKVSLPLKRWVSGEVKQFDLVHIHALFSHSSIEAARAARKAEVPYLIRPLGVLNQYGVRSRRRWLKKLSLVLREAPVIRDAAAMHFTSEAERDEAAQLGIPMTSRIIPLGIEVPDMLPNRESATSSRVLFLSRIDPKKNLESLIEAWSLLAPDTRRTWRLQIAGSGEETYVGRLQEQAKRCGIAGEIDWMGFVEGAEKARLLAGAAVFALPSFSENFGIAAVEAMGAGIPSILTPGVAAGAAAAAANGCLLTGTSPHEIAGALTRLIDSPEQRQGFSERGHAFVKDRFSITAMAGALDSLYGEILHSRVPS